MKKYQLIYLIFLGLLFSACMPRNVREAQCTVAQADSVWLAGHPSQDSLSLAQAYATLGKWQFFYPDEYTHACYRYGRLLRTKNNPVAAMQCFISATHTRTHDYHIIGRVYSNMGEMCHLAGDYELTYDMYGCSANMFLLNGDTLNYFYALNDMAFEKAMLRDNTGVFLLTDSIERHCTNEDVLTKILESKAELYLRTQQYDSAIYYAKQYLSANTNYSAINLIIAQAYSYLGIGDSATLYANIVLSQNHTLYEANNALYILTADDNSKDIDAVREVSAERADTQKIIEIRKSELSQSVQLLEQDLEREPDLTWLYAIIATFLILGCLSAIYIHIKRKRHELLTQKIEDLENKKDASIAQKMSQIEEISRLLINSPNMKADLQWKNYDAMCEIIDKYFFLLAKKLKQCKKLNEQEIRLCILVFLNYNRNQIANILPYAQNGVGKLKYRVAHKLGIEGKKLRKFLISMAIDEPFK